ncbi:MAG TPA: OB-fold nucleic acid binding domain-containing protein, partial [Clostridiales bacterium]|nr:OB-fold nucleic acid binding domain-containing protein [Clostridiales bacterium]
AAYAIVSYQTAYMKAHYPVEFMAATLNSFVGNSDKISYYVQECRQEGIEVLPPDVNESDVRFTVANGKIRFGMAAVKNVGESAVRELIDERDKRGLFKNFYDFCERIGERDFNKRCVESLIKCGAFDSFGVYRSKMMAVYEKLLESAQQGKKSRVEGQLSLFEMSGQIQKMKTEESYPDLKEFSREMLLSMEKEMLGLYISGHPLDEFKNELMEQITVNSKDINAYGSEGEDDGSGGTGLIDGMLVTVGGIITEVKTKTTRSNNLMAFVTLEDLYGSMEVIVFPTVLTRYRHQLTSDNVVIIDGRISIKEEEVPKIICENVRMLKKKEISENGHVMGANGVSAKNERYEILYIRSDIQENSDMMKSVISLLKFFSGKVPVVFCRSDETGNIARANMGEYRVDACDTLQRELKERFGEDNVKLVSKAMQKQQ